MFVSLMLQLKGAIKRFDEGQQKPREIRELSMLRQRRQEHKFFVCPQGINCTVCAYGQTGSGKTHTMFGPKE